MRAAALLIVAFLSAAVLSGIVRKQALLAGIVDRPNARSSHTGVVPRGGGIGVIAAVFLALGLGLVLGYHVSVAVATPLLGVLVVAGVGWQDDRVGLGVKARLVAHVLAAISLVPLVLAPSPMPAWLNVAAAAWWILWAVSSVNVVNFMDGIDGLIASQAAIFGTHLVILSPPSDPSEALGLVLAGAGAGFLVWNWAPAKLFLGDVGSGALGLLMVVGGALTMRSAHVGFAATFLPLYPIFLDATTTLLLRAARGERISEAHRSHLYQRLANGGWGHRRVSVLYGVASLAGVAVGALHRADPSWAMVTAYGAVVFCVGLALRLTSGPLDDRADGPHGGAGTAI